MNKDLVIMSLSRNTLPDPSSPPIRVYGYNMFLSKTNEKGIICVLFGLPLYTQNLVQWIVSLLFGSHSKIQLRKATRDIVCWYGLKVTWSIFSILSWIKLLRKKDIVGRISCLF
jgi:hypothetical protein